MNVVYTDEFVKQFHKLPQVVQTRFRIQEQLFKANWRDARLHVKKLKGNVQTFSFRITRNYRVLFLFVEHETALFATIGHRKDVYR